MKIVRDFSNDCNQSNPIFGEVVNHTDAVKMAEKCWTISLNAVLLTEKDAETCNIINVSSKDLSKQEDYFLNELQNTILDLDQHIKEDSKGKRRAFLFVMTRGNGYLAKVRNDPEFNKWINNNHIGIYVTSSKVQGLKASEYSGGGYIKKANEIGWRDENYNISDFLDIIMNNSIKYSDVNLTRNEIYNNINVLINIGQLNTGNNLPALNGIFVSRYLDKNCPEAIQGPGRTVRPEPEDIGKIEQWNKEISNFNIDTHPELKSELIKPTAYLYYSMAEFTAEEQAGLRDTLKVIYQNIYMKKIIHSSQSVGTKSPKDPPKNDDDNKNEDVRDAKEELNSDGLTKHSLMLDIRKTFNSTEELSNEFDVTWRNLVGIDENAYEWMGEYLKEHGELKGNWSLITGTNNIKERMKTLKITKDVK